MLFSVLTQVGLVAVERRLRKPEGSTAKRNWTLQGTPPTRRGPCVRLVAWIAFGTCVAVGHWGAWAEESEPAAGPESAELDALEGRLRADPRDREARVALIRRYARNQWADASAARRRADLVVWLVENAPRDALFETSDTDIHPGSVPERYVRAKALWLGHLARAPDDLRLLGNAASFFALRDRELAMSLLESAQAIDPGNPVWPFELGQLHWRDGKLRRSEDSLALAAPLFERAHAIAAGDDERLPMYVVYAIRGTFDAGRHADARAYASEALTRTGSDWWDGDVRHHANLVLGAIALAEGDVERAKWHLLAAGRVAHSPTLRSGGPNMELARDLIEAGEREAVLEYFELCSRFWDPERLGAWGDLVRAGRTPDFGANLYL